ncbi:MAG: hypothetical protein PHC40_04015 [Eubacteriales bacterium]|nr:hypothetical protein [Eubacteriales bacterium]
MDPVDGFHQSLMINLVRESGENYLLVAEAVNQWVVNLALPPGNYEVDTVTIDKDPHGQYQAGYEKKLVVRSKEVSSLKIRVRENTVNSSKDAMGTETKEDPEQEALSTGARTDLWGIVKKMWFSLALVLASLIFLAVKKRKEYYG